MADIPNRTELEAELAKRWSRIWARHKKELTALLGDPPNMGNVPASFWEKAGIELNGTFIPFIVDVSMDAAERLTEGLPIGADWGLVNERAARWANEYSGQFIRDIDNTTRRAVQEAVSKFYSQGLTRGDLEARLARIYSPTRASSIAVTEVTRAATRGEQLIAIEIAKEGIEMIPVFQTNNDEKVCPICSPLDGKDMIGEYEGVYPPLHTNCRCWLNHRLPKVKR